MFEEQPTVHLSASAVKVVVSVLRTVMDKPDGKDVLRKLLIDGLLFLERSQLEPSPAGTTKSTGARRERTRSGACVAPVGLIGKPRNVWAAPDPKTVR